MIGAFSAIRQSPLSSKTGFTPEAYINKPGYFFNWQAQTLSKFFTNWVLQNLSLFVPSIPQKSICLQHVKTACFGPTPKGPISMTSLCPWIKTCCCSSGQSVFCQFYSECSQKRSAEEGYFPLPDGAESFSAGLPFHEPHPEVHENLTFQQHFIQAATEEARQQTWILSTWGIRFVSQTLAPAWRRLAIGSESSTRRRKAAYLSGISDAVFEAEPMCLGLLGACTESTTLPGTWSVSLAVTSISLDCCPRENP